MLATLAPVHVHLDPVGGVAGDMFVAAMVDAWPELDDVVIGAVAAVGVEAKLIEHHDGVTGGRRFVVEAPESPAHRRHRDLVELVTSADLAPEVRRRIESILGLLAEAESVVHGVPIDAVTFHEIGAWDSLADVVGAAAAIEACDVSSWSCGPLPLGGGSVRTRHGVLPVPAPATMVLLGDLPVVDDGVGGERVTPTGAAIVRSLEPTPDRAPGAHRIAAVGHGFGTRSLSDRPNIVRLSSLVRHGGSTDRIGVVELDIDDQSPEDLAVGLDRIRAVDGVVDVIQRTALGKKGRMVIEVRVMCRPEVLDRVVDACFAETTTLGVRRSVAERVVLERVETATDGVRRKSVTRPDGRITTKIDIDDLADAGDRIDRERRRRRAETPPDPGKDPGIVIR